ncbi:MAG: hypothetical protein L3J29_00020 [Cyclobacteriaceae bacterium]|nr:hypothetical protein [Cyclobacteriaceae bacterium]
MKKYFIIGAIILIAGLVINYKFGGFEKTEPQLIEVSDYAIYGASYEGSYKSNALSSLVSKMQTLQKNMADSSNVVLVNYIDEAKETLGIVSNFVGIITEGRGMEDLEKKTIKANKAIRVVVKINPLTMPSPEKIKALAFEMAEKEGLVLQKLSIEQYQEDDTLVIDFPVKEEASFIEKLAYAYGVDKFNKANTFRYIFNVKMGATEVARSWVWQPNSGEVTLITKGDTTRFNHKSFADDQKKLDHTFINDKYWLLFPFQLIWDTGYTHSLVENVEAPISKKVTTKLTIAYNSEDGYTPGDAYDFYIDDSFEIKEWSFRKGGQEEPSLTTTWQDYKMYDGVKISTNHVSDNGDFRLWFTEIKID